VGSVKKNQFIQKGHQMNNLSHLNIDEVELICELIESMKHIYSMEKSAGLVSEKTQNEYVKEAQRILKKRKDNGDSLSKSVNSTTKKSTFFKRISALKYYLTWIGSTSALTLSEIHEEDSLHNIKLAIRDIKELRSIIDNGFVGTLEKRESKRNSIKGLPNNWLEMLCNYNTVSKYREAFQVISLTGCRPSELVKGVQISLSENTKKNSATVEFVINGTKISETKGQPIRRIYYDCNTSNELLHALIETTNLIESNSAIISIESAVNFTNEIKRIAKILWPKHQEYITSYSIRHQIASNFKRHLSGDDVSKVLGHSSPKTKKTYGSAGQSKGVSPDITVSSSREIKQPQLSADEFNKN